MRATDAAAALVALGRPGEHIEAFVRRRVDVVLRQSGRTPRASIRADDMRLAVALRKDGRWGNTTTADLSTIGLRIALSRARDAARTGSGSADGRVPAAPASVAAPLSGVMAAAPVAAAFDLMERIERASTSLDGAMSVRELTVGHRNSEVGLCVSDGVPVGYRTVFAQALVRVGAVTESRSAYAVDTSRSLREIQAGHLLAEAAVRAVGSAGERPERPLPRLLRFDRFVAAQLLERVAMAFDWARITADSSLVGTRLFPAPFSLLDDSTHPDGPLTAPFDDNGTSTGVHTLVDHGRIVAVLGEAAGCRRRLEVDQRPVPTFALPRLAGPVTPIGAEDDVLLVHEITGLGRGHPTDLDNPIRLELTGILQADGADAPAVRCLLSTSLRRLCLSLSAVGDDDRVVPLSIPVLGQSLLFAVDASDRAEED
jgi:predicted Zn-dependent protease